MSPTPASATPPDRPLTQRITAGKAVGLADYEATGGYQALRAALGRLAPSELTERVKAAGLRGRGGAGFPTGVKWSLVPLDPPGTRHMTHKYFIANGDEMEPGTFKDRVLLEGDPHQLIEGMILGAYAIQADVGYIFLRAEYHLAARLLEDALAECYAKGYLGKNILGSGFDHELHLHTSAGRYICGEETALISSLEGQRAVPRARPPFPAISGLFGKPTVVNNIETICCVPHIVLYGADWFHSIARSKDGGTKLYGVSGKVRRPGCWELPLGATGREILEEHAGGMRDGLRLKGFLPGGASTDFLTAEHLDLAMDFDTIAKAGSRLGTGTMIVLDDHTCPIGMVLSLERFFARESCGWCTPCRDGLPWTERLLESLEAGDGRPGDLDLLAGHARLLGPGRTFCALAPGAMEPVQSALEHFRAELERAIAAEPPRHAGGRGG